jgi:hypothetical protein
MMAAYNRGSTMARTLETLDPGTPVFAGSTRVATVAAVYAEGAARAVEVIAVRWDASGEELSIPASQILRIDDEGVHLIRTEPDQYADLAPFDPARFPTLKKLK